MKDKKFCYSEEQKEDLRRVLRKDKKSQLVNYLIHVKEVCENYFLENIDLKVNILSLENKLHYKNKQK